MKLSIISACAALMLVATGASAQMECRAPYEPSVPERFETEEQLMATYEEVKTYVAKSTEYIECLDAMRSSVDPAAEDRKEQEKTLDSKNDRNVDSQNAVNNRFKAAYSIWKEENPE